MRFFIYIFQPFTPSFLSMDTDCRVIRLDTFSKTVGPGFRLGFMSAPVPIFNHVKKIAQVSNQGASHISQVNCYLSKSTSLLLVLLAFV